MGQVNNVAKSKAFFYLMSAAAAFQAYKIFLDRSVYCGGMFLLTGAIACQFTKNKALCLLAGLVVTNFVVGCSRIVEGFKEGNDHMGGGGSTSCADYDKEADCASPCSWQNGECKDPPGGGAPGPV